MIFIKILNRCHGVSRNLTSVRLISSNSAIGEVMTVAELTFGGAVSQKKMAIEDILRYVDRGHPDVIPKKIPIRDLRLLIRKPSSSVSKMPAILPRPSSNCFILDVEHLKVLCFSDKVNGVTSISNRLNNVISCFSAWYLILIEKLFKTFCPMWGPM